MMQRSLETSYLMKTHLNKKASRESSTKSLRFWQSHRKQQGNIQQKIPLFILRYLHFLILISSFMILPYFIKMSANVLTSIAVILALLSHNQFVFDHLLLFGHHLPASFYHHWASHRHHHSGSSTALYGSITTTTTQQPTNHQAATRQQ